MAHSSLPVQEQNGGRPWWHCGVLHPLYLAFHMLEHLKRAEPCPSQLTELKAENREERGKERLRKDGLLSRD